MWSVIIAAYIAAYLLLMNIGYYLKLPHYSRRNHLRTGKNFRAQWNERQRIGNDIMVRGSVIFAILTGILLFAGLLIPWGYSIEKHHLVEVVQLKTNSVTLIVVDGNVFKENYYEYNWLKANYPGIFIYKTRNIYGMSLSEYKLQINAYFDPDEYRGG